MLENRTLVPAVFACPVRPLEWGRIGKWLVIKGLAPRGKKIRSAVSGSGIERATDRQRRVSFGTRSKITKPNDCRYRACVLDHFHKQCLCVCLTTS